MIQLHLHHNLHVRKSLNQTLSWRLSAEAIRNNFYFAENKNYYNLGYTAGLAEINNSDIEYVYHHHTDDCLGTVTKTCTITKRFTTENHPAAWNSIWCGTCNANTYHDGMKITHSSCGQATDYQILNCSRHADNSNYYSTSTHTYTGTGYICGYNEGDIEKATIVIKK